MVDEFFGLDELTGKHGLGNDVLVFFTENKPIFTGDAVLSVGADGVGGNPAPGFVGVTHFPLSLHMTLIGRLEEPFEAEDGIFGNAFGVVIHPPHVELCLSITGFGTLKGLRPFVFHGVSGLGFIHVLFGQTGGDIQALHHIGQPDDFLLLPMVVHDEFLEVHGGRLAVLARV